MRQAELQRPWLFAAASLSPAYAAAAPPRRRKPRSARAAGAARACGILPVAGEAPLWLAPSAGDAAQGLVALLKSADIDRAQPAIAMAVAALGQGACGRRRTKSKAVQRADIMLSQAFVAYVDDLRRDPGVGITYVDPQLRPTPPIP